MRKFVLVFNASNDLPFLLSDYVFKLLFFIDGLYTTKAYL